MLYLLLSRAISSTVPSKISSLGACNSILFSICIINSYYNDINAEEKTNKKTEKKTSQKNKKHQNQQKSLERKITKLEEKQTSLEFELYETNDTEKLKEIQEQLSKLKKEIEVNFESLMDIGN